MAAEVFARFDRLSGRVAAAYRDVPMADGLAEINEAVMSGRRGRNVLVEEASDYHGAQWS